MLFECNGCNRIAEEVLQDHLHRGTCLECESRLVAVRCKGCGSIDVTDTKPSYHHWWRTDHYDIPTGHYCDSCFNDDKKYPYKRGAYYDYFEAGELLEPEED